MDDAERWLDNEDRVAREVRLERLRWLADQMPKVEWMLYGTGPISKYLFEEMRYCFAYGQYLASIVLGLAFIELSLGGTFYSAGRNDLEKAGIAALSKEALRYGWLSQDYYQAIEEMRKYRNPITHFRPPGHDDRVEARAFYSRTNAYEIIEGDARQVMETVFQLLVKMVPWAAKELPNYPIPD
jgi:hypothetical protein